MGQVSIYGHRVKFEVTEAKKAENPYFLPNEVITATSVNSFKNRLDSFWADQVILYNYKANITGNRGMKFYLTFHLTISMYLLMMWVKRLCLHSY